jgi:hypothetical protein
LQISVQLLHLQLLKTAHLVLKGGGGGLAHNELIEDRRVSELHEYITGVCYSQKSCTIFKACWSPIFHLVSFKRTGKLYLVIQASKESMGTRPLWMFLKQTHPFQRDVSNRVKQMIPPNMLWSQMVHSSYALVMDLCY